MPIFYTELPQHKQKDPHRLEEVVNTLTKAAGQPDPSEDIHAVGGWKDDLQCLHLNEIYPIYRQPRIRALWATRWTLIFSAISKRMVTQVWVAFMRPVAVCCVCDYGLHNPLSLLSALIHRRFSEGPSGHNVFPFAGHFRICSAKACQLHIVLYVV